MNEETERPAIVYASQACRKFDLTRVGGYGTLKTVIPFGVQVGQDGANAVGIQLKLEEDLRTYRTHKDFVLLVGDPVIMGLTLHVVLAMHGAANVLKWDRRRSSYYPVRVKATAKKG